MAPGDSNPSAVESAFSSEALCFETVFDRLRTPSFQTQGSTKKHVFQMKAKPTFPQKCLAEQSSMMYPQRSSFRLLFVFCKLHDEYLCQRAAFSRGQVGTLFSLRDRIQYPQYVPTHVSSSAANYHLLHIMVRKGMKLENDRKPVTPTPWDVRYVSNVLVCPGRRREANSKCGYLWIASTWRVANPGSNVCNNVPKLLPSKSEAGNSEYEVEYSRNNQPMKGRVLSRRKLRARTLMRSIPSRSDRTCPSCSAIIKVWTRCKAPSSCSRCVGQSIQQTNFSSQNRKPLSSRYTQQVRC